MNDTELRPEFQPSESGFGCTVSWVDDTELCKRMAYAVGGVVQAVLANGFNLSRLEGTTISANYTQSLSELERGFAATGPLRPTEEFGVGMAMAAPVLRDGTIMARLMLDAGIAMALLSDDEEQRSFGLCTVVHELAHIQDLANKDGAIPGVFLRPYPGDVLQAHLFNMSSPAWDEFYATSMSVRLQPTSLDAFDEVLEGAVSDLLDRAAAARRAFFAHRDFGRAMREMIEPIGTLLKFSAYVLGSLDGLDRGDEYGPKSAQTVRASRFGPTFDALREALRKMADAYCDWKDLGAYEPIQSVALEALATEGLVLSLQANGQLWIQVKEPDDFTPQQRMAWRLGMPVLDA